MFLRLFMREFGIIQDKFPGAGDVYKDWAEASIANLSDTQREKLFGILNPKPEVVSLPVSSQEEVVAKGTTISGDIADVWDKIPEKQRLDMEYGIQHVLSQGYKSDLVLGRWAKKHTGGGWEETLGQAGFVDQYNLISKPKDKHIPGSSNILLVLRVSPTGENTADITSELLEIPSFDGGRQAMLMPGMVFHKPLQGDEFIEQIHLHKDDLSIAA